MKTFKYSCGKLCDTTDTEVYCRTCFSTSNSHTICNGKYLFCNKCITKQLYPAPPVCPICSTILIESLQYTAKGNILKIDSGCSSKNLEDSYTEVVKESSRKAKYGCLCRENVSRLNNEMFNIKILLNKILGNQNILKACVLPPPVGFGTIMIAGGRMLDFKPVKSVELLMHSTHRWLELPLDRFGYAKTVAHVYMDSVLIAGMYGDTYELGTLKCIEDFLEFRGFPLDIPCHWCKLPESVIFMDHLVLFCTCDTHAPPTQVCLKESVCVCDATNIIVKMPYFAIKNFCAVMIDDRVLFVGGEDNDGNITSNVYEYTFGESLIKTLVPLPYAVKYAGSVRWGNFIIVVGGTTYNGVTGNAAMYDPVSGTVVALPSMLSKRTLCSAVVTGNRITVIGGYMDNYFAEPLGSSESLNIGSNAWTYDSSITYPRGKPAVVVLPQSIGTNSFNVCGSAVNLEEPSVFGNIKIDKWFS